MGGDHWAPLPLPGAGRRRVRALIELGRVLAAHLGGDPLPVPSDWAAVAATAESYHLTPVLWEATRHTTGMDEGIITRLRAEYAANVVVNARMADQLRHALVALNRGGIEPVVLKGALQLLRQEATPPARMMTDIDLLVTPEDIDNACSALRQVGYDVYPGPGAAARFEWTARRPDLAAPIDLHHALGLGAVTRALPGSAVLERAVRHQREGVSYLVLEPADQLAHAVVHSQCNDRAHRTGAIALRQLYNFAVLYQDHGGTDAWRIAARRLTEAALPHVVGGHAALERHLFRLDLPVPEPNAAASLHLARCLVTYAVPHLSDVETNFLLTFETQNMTERYPGASTNSARLRHAVGLLRGGTDSVRSGALRSRNH
jgi:hypothetical protein